LITVFIISVNLPDNLAILFLIRTGILCGTWRMHLFGPWALLSVSQTLSAIKLNKHEQLRGARTVERRARHQPDLVSVVIPTFNHANFLPEAIQSVQKQTYGFVEIIVIDDGSNDETEHVVKSYQGIRYVKQRNRGVTAARNVGLKLSAGSYVLFLDADDRLLPEAIEIGIRSLRANPDCALTFGSFYMIDREGRRKGGCHPLSQRRYGYSDFLEQNFIGNPGVALYRKDPLVAVDGFDATNQAAGDYDLYLRRTYAFPVACHTEPVLEYRRHGTNMSNDPAVMLPARPSCCPHAFLH
jgi:cellulose synthase/poly-beta-1,6-N-acetylglucosamine synthase-like glycosyltransferase